MENEIKSQLLDLLVRAKKRDESIRIGKIESESAKQKKNVKGSNAEFLGKITFSEMLRRGQLEKKFNNEIAHNFAEQKQKKFSWDDPESVEKLQNIWNAEPEVGAIHIDWDRCGQWYYCCFGPDFPPISQHWRARQAERPIPKEKPHKCKRKEFQAWNARMIKRGQLRKKKREEKELATKELDRRKLI